MLELPLTAARVDGHDGNAGEQSADDGDGGFGRRLGEYGDSILALEAGRERGSGVPKLVKTERPLAKSKRLARRRIEQRRKERRVPHLPQSTSVRQDS